jgi:hypothetical protein
MVVRSELEKLGLHCIRVELGEAETRESLSSEQLARLRDALKKSGLELMEDHKAILIERTRTRSLRWFIIPKSRSG